MGGLLGSIGLCLAQGEWLPADSAGRTLVGVMLVGMIAGIAWHAYSTRAMRQELSWLRRQEMSSKDRQVVGDRDENLFDQHMTLNALTAEKLRLEAQYLQLQTDIARKEIEARGRMDKYHDLMTQKAQLEVQSLRLHIREQRKRLDDFTSFDED